MELNDQRRLQMGSKVTRTMVILLASGLACISLGTGIALAGTAKRPACGSHPCPITTTKAPVAIKLGRLKSAGVMTVGKTTVKCYHIQGWESWNTNLGKLTFFDQVHWCGTPYVQVYLNRTQCNPFHQLVAFWDSDSGTCSFGYGNNTRVIHTEATQDWKLHSPLNPLTLEEIEPKLCVDVYANGFAKITCHD